MLRYRLDNIVVLGASFEGVNIALQLLYKIRHELSTAPNATRYRVVLVAPNLRLFSPLIAPNALYPDWSNEVERYFIPYIHCFDAYTDDEFIFIKSRATSLDFGQRIVHIEPSGTDARSRHSLILQDKLVYHTLIIATGSVAKSELLSLHGDEDSTIKAIRRFQTEIGHARRCVIVGGGRMGVECAGRIGTWASTTRQALSSCCKSCFGCGDGALQDPTQDDRLPLMLSTRPATPSSFLASDKTFDIVLVSGAARLLPNLHEKIGRRTEKTLEGLGVRVVHGVRQVSAQALPNHATKCILANGQNITSDMYIDATGFQPDTEFIPPAFKNADGYVIINKGTLRVPGAGLRVFALGSCAAIHSKTDKGVPKSISVLSHNLMNDLLEYEMRLQNGRYEGLFGRLRLLKDIKFRPRLKRTQSVLVADHNALCMFKGMEMPSSIANMLISS